MGAYVRCGVHCVPCGINVCCVDASPLGSSGSVVARPSPPGMMSLEEASKILDVSFQSKGINMDLVRQVATLCGAHTHTQYIQTSVFVLCVGLVCSSLNAISTPTTGRGAGRFTCSLNLSAPWSDSRQRPRETHPKASSHHKTVTSNLITATIQINRHRRPSADTIH